MGGILRVQLANKYTVIFSHDYTRYSEEIRSLIKFTHPKSSNQLTLETATLKFCKFSVVIKIFLINLKMIHKA